MNLYLAASIVALIVVVFIIHFTLPADEPMQLQSPFEVLDFDNTYLDRLELVPQYVNTPKSSLAYAFEQVLMALTFAISVFLALGIVKLHLGNLYKL